VAAVQPDCVSADILQVLGNRSLVVLSAILCFRIAWCLDVNKIVFHRIVSCVTEDLNGEKQFFVSFANCC